MKDRSNSCENLNSVEHNVLIRRIAIELSILQRYALDIQNSLSDLRELDGLDTNTTIKLQALDLMSQVLDDVSNLMSSISMDGSHSTHNLQEIEKSVRLTDLRRRLMGNDLARQTKNDDSGELRLL